MKHIEKVLNGKGKLFHASELPEYLQDELIVAALKDNGATAIAVSYMLPGAGSDYKDEVFESVMHIIDKAIEKHNASLPVETYNERDFDSIFGSSKNISINQAMYDAGHKFSDF